MTKKVMGIAMALLLGVGVAGAWADDVEGKIAKVDAGERVIQLEDGTRLVVAEGVPMDNLAEGKTLKASFEERDGNKIATSVEVSE